MQHGGRRAAVTARDPAAAAEHDRRALERCAAGDARELETLYRRHAGTCLAHARGVLRDDRSAEAAVQEAFVDLWRHAGRFDESRSTVGGWLLMLTHRRAVDRLRAEQHRSTSALPGERDDRSGPDVEALLSSLSEDARRTLTSLPCVQREAVVLAYCGGYTQTEIARLTGTPLGTVRTSMLAGVRQLTVA